MQNYLCKSICAKVFVQKYLSIIICAKVFIQDKIHEMFTIPEEMGLFWGVLMDEADEIVLLVDVVERDRVATGVTA